jgi:hypothetical protein
VVPIPSKSPFSALVPICVRLLDCLSQFSNSLLQSLSSRLPRVFPFLLLLPATAAQPTARFSPLTLFVYDADPSHFLPRRTLVERDCGPLPGQKQRLVQALARIAQGHYYLPHSSSTLSYLLLLLLQLLQLLEMMFYIGPSTQNQFTLELKFEGTLSVHNSNFPQSTAAGSINEALHWPQSTAI